MQRVVIDLIGQCQEDFESLSKLCALLAALCGTQSKWQTALSAELPQMLQTAAHVVERPPQSEALTSACVAAVTLCSTIIRQNGEVASVAVSTSSCGASVERLLNAAVSPPRRVGPCCVHHLRVHSCCSSRQSIGGGGMEGAPGRKQRVLSRCHSLLMGSRV